MLPNIKDKSHKKKRKKISYKAMLNNKNLNDFIKEDDEKEV
jgi:hypothetical protein